MPTYTYRCDKCEETFDIFHPMSETVGKCKKCDFPLKKIIPTRSNIRKSSNYGKARPGSIVDKYIDDMKAEVHQEKQRLKTKEYK